MKVSYRANDGKEFDKKTDCENYEKLFDFPIVADASGNIINLKAILASQTDYKIEMALASIDYIYAKEENAQESYQNLYDLMARYEHKLPKPEKVVTDVGVALYWDDDKDWQSYYDLENKFYTLENQFNMMF